MSDDQTYPAWFYGPDEQSGVFSGPEEVPTGWVDHPSKLAAAELDDAPRKRGRPPKTLEEAVEQPDEQF